MTTNLEPLALRVEAGTAEQQRELLLEAYDAIDPRPATEMVDGIWSKEFLAWRDRFLLFRKHLELGTDEAFTAAAMMLIPPRWRFGISTIGTRPGASLYTPAGNAVDGGYAFAATPALALLLAIARAATPAGGEG